MSVALMMYTRNLFDSKCVYDAVQKAILIDEFSINIITYETMRLPPLLT